MKGHSSEYIQTLSLNTTYGKSCYRCKLRFKWILILMIWGIHYCRVSKLLNFMA